MNNQIMDDSKLIIKAIGELKKDLITRISQVETKLGSRISQVETKLGDRVESLGNKISDVETVLSAKIDDTNINIDNLRKETKQGFIDINNRADLLGKQLNTLDEDAPTGEDFKNLVKRVDKLEKFKTFATA